MLEEGGREEGGREGGRKEWREGGREGCHCGISHDVVVCEVSEG